MSYTREELGAMTLQRLAYVLPQNAEDEKLVQEVFEARAAASSYQTLTSVDVKQGWQEVILQKYVDEKRQTMALENPATLSAEDEAALDTNVITKEKELELQAKLDEKNGKTPVVEGVIDAVQEQEVPTGVKSADAPVIEQAPKEDVSNDTKKKGRTSKK